MSILVPLLLIAGLVLYLMTPEERRRAARSVARGMGRLTHAVVERASGDLQFHEALRARTRLALVTPALVFASVATFLFMAVSGGGGAEALVAWGANFAPRTTNDEWWRLVASTFVHSGALHLLATMAGLLSAGLVLERLIGPAAFLTVYVAAGALASLVSLSESPLAVSVGASGAVFGIYGLLLASAAWGFLTRREAAIPMPTVKRLGAAAGVFAVYNLLAADLSTAGEMTGLATGCAAGLLLTPGIVRDKPPARRLAFAWAATLVLAVAWAVPLRGTTDVRPVLQRIVAVEEHTAAEYEKRVAEFRKGWISAETLAESIEKTVLPELQAAHARLRQVRGVPREHQPLIAAAEEYFTLRQDAWRRRADGLTASSMERLRHADSTERASLEAFHRMKSANLI